MATGMKRLAGALLLLALSLSTAQANWDPPTLIGNGGALWPGRPVMVAVGPDTLHYIYGSQRTGKPEIYYRRSIDGGRSWGAVRRLTDETSPRRFGRRFSIAADRDNVYAVWSEFHSPDDGRLQSLWMVRSTDAGDSWTEQTPMNPDPLEWTDHGAVSASGRYVHVVWSSPPDSGETRVDYRRSTDFGATWSDTRVLGYGFAPNPGLTGAGSVLHLTWNSWVNGADSVFHCYRRSEDNGETWGDSTWLAADPFDPSSTSISIYENTHLALSGSNAYIVWSSDQDNRSTGYYTDIYIRASTDEGKTWGPAERITNYQDDTASGNVAADPWLVVTDNGLHLVWDNLWDVLSYDFGRFNNQVKYLQSSDGGVTWGEEVFLSEPQANNYPYSYPQIIAVGEDLHAIWQDAGAAGVLHRLNPGGSSSVWPSATDPVSDRYLLLW